MYVDFGYRTFSAVIRFGVKNTRTFRDVNGTSHLRPISGRNNTMTFWDVNGRMNCNLYRVYKVYIRSLYRVILFIVCIGSNHRYIKPYKVLL